MAVIASHACKNELEDGPAKVYKLAVRERLSFSGELLIHNAHCFSQYGKLLVKGDFRGSDFLKVSSAIKKDNLVIVAGGNQDFSGLDFSFLPTMVKHASYIISAHGNFIVNHVQDKNYRGTKLLQIGQLTFWVIGEGIALDIIQENRRPNSELSLVLQSIIKNKKKS